MNVNFLVKFERINLQDPRPYEVDATCKTSFGLGTYLRTRQES